MKNLVLMLLFACIASISYGQNMLSIADAASRVVDAIEDKTTLSTEQSQNIYDMVMNEFGDLETASIQDRRKALRERLPEFLSHVDAELTADQKVAVAGLKKRLERNFIRN